MIWSRVTLCNVGMMGSELAVAQHRQAVAETEDLVEPVRDVEDDGALARSRSISANRISLSRDDSEEVGSSSAMTRASSMTALAISTICRSPMDSEATLAARIDIDADLGWSFAADVVDQPAPVDDAGLGRETAEPEIFGNGQFGNQLQFLVDDDDAGIEGIADGCVALLIAVDA